MRPELVVVQEPAGRVRLMPSSCMQLCVRSATAEMHVMGGEEEIKERVWFGLTVLVDHHRRVPVLNLQVFQHFVQSPWRLIVPQPKLRLLVVPHCALKRDCKIMTVVVYNKNEK